MKDVDRVDDVPWLSSHWYEYETTDDDYPREPEPQFDTFEEDRGER